MCMGNVSEYTDIQGDSSNRCLSRTLPSYQKHAHNRPCDMTGGGSLRQPAASSWPMLFLPVLACVCAGTGCCLGGGPLLVQESGLKCVDWLRWVLCWPRMRCGCVRVCICVCVLHSCRALPLGNPCHQQTFTLDLVQGLSQALSISICCQV